MNIDIPEFPEAIELNERASLLISNGNFEQALEYLKKAMAIDKMEIQTYFNLGNLYGCTGEYKKSEDAFKKVVLIDKTNPLTYFNLGNLRFLQDDIEGGVEYYNKAISYGYNDSNIYYNLGMIYEELENYDMAIRNYSKAVNKDKLNPEYRLKQASVYIKNEKYNEALEVLEELNKYCPDIFEGYHYRFEIYCNQEKYKEAKKIIDKAIEMFPKDISLLYDKVRLFNLEEKYDEALGLIDKAKCMDGYEVEERNFEFEKAKIYAQKEDSKETIQSLKKCISYEDEEKDTEARYLLMNAYISIGDYENALGEAEALSEIQDGESEYVMSAIYYKAFCLNKLNREDEAKEQYKEAKKLFRALTISNPTNLDAYIFRILCHKDLKEYDKALELIDYIIILKDDIGELYNIKGTILKEIGYIEKAEEAFNKAKKYNSIFAS